MLLSFLRWADVDPTGRPFDPAPAAAIALRHVRAAVGGDLGRRTPIAGVERDDVEAAIARELVVAYGPWAAAWSWSPSEPGDGGPVPGWCCARDSVLADGDRDARATIERVVAAVTALRALLEELAARFAELRAAAAGLPLERGVEHAAAALLPLVLERTGAEDAWYRTFCRFLAWYVETLGGEPEALAVIDDVVGGRFASWITPDAGVAAEACRALGDAVGRALVDEAVDDAQPAWRALRGHAFGAGPSPGARVEVSGDAHRAFIDHVDRARDPVRAERMLAALAACRASAARGEPLTFDRLAAWQGLVLGLDDGAAPFRSAPAYARAGRVHYELGHRTRGLFEAALAEAGSAEPVAVRAARAYLDVCFFHPFADGNARSARLAVDHVVTSAGLALHAVEPVFVVARAADDRRGAFCLAWAIELLLGPRADQAV